MKTSLTFFKSLKKRGMQFGFGFIALSLILILYKSQFAYFYSFVNRIDGVIYDSLVKLNFQKRQQTARVVIIDIDDYSIQSQGRWPWPRDKFVTLLNNLKKAGVTVVGFDIVFSEAEINYAQGLKNKLIQIDYPKPPQLSQIITFLNEVSKKVDNDQAFASALRVNDVVLGYLFHHDASIRKGVLPKPLLNGKSEFIDASALSIPAFQGYNGVLELLLKAAPNSGFVSNIPDVDGVIRQGLLLANYDNQLYSSLALSLVMRYLLVDKLELVTHVTLGKQVLYGINVGGIFIPTNNHGQMLIPFWDSSQTIPSYSASDIIENKIPSQELEGAIVLVGSSMVLLADLHASPVSQSFPGVEMVANMVSGMLGHQTIKEFNWSTAQGLIVLVLTGAFFAILFPFLSPLALLITYVISIISILVTAFFLVAYSNYYVATTILLFSVTLLAIINFMYDFILERLQKNKIRRLFDMYVPPSYVKEIMENPEKYSMDGENREMTVFFADIRGFTTLSESLDASEVKHLLNEFFTPITNIIFNHQGTIDKYVGDMVMAFWGAPLADHEHPYHAIQAVLDMRLHLTEINNTLIQQNLPSISLGMGLSTGMMNVGDMGSSFRRSYTVIGDEVNLASRLQDLTKYYQVDILASETTRANQDAFLWRPIDKVTVKGRQKAVIIYEPLGYYQDASPQVLEELHDLEQGLSAYYKQDWSTAKKYFKKLASLYSNTYLYQIYLKRVEEFYLNPPAKNWDGSFIYTQK